MPKDDEIRLHRGLREIYFDRTETTFIDGGNGVLEYRGYNIHDLAEHSNFEETSYLLLHGELPTQEHLDAFDEELRSQRELPEQVFPIIRSGQGFAPYGRSPYGGLGHVGVRPG